MPTPSPGRLYRDRVFPSPASLPCDLFINYREVECEFAFQLAQDLPARRGPYGEDDVASAVGSAHPVLEIGDMVFRDWYASSGYFGPSLDNGGGGALVCGPRIEAWRSRGLSAVRIELRLNGRVAKTGVGGAAMGDPLTSLTWMANWASEHGTPLRAGEIVSTGTCTGHCFVSEGDFVTADFGDCGVVSAEMRRSIQTPDRRPLQ
ncbi:MAG: 2-keto-4-pentenoate hydratase [Candidatus Dormibacteria bacterium]